jgi:hypothetical protein
MEGPRVCRVCATAKYKTKWGWRCPACACARTKRHREACAQMVHVIDPLAPKWCPRCQQTKTCAEFGSKRTLLSGLHEYCKPCNVTTVMTSQTRHPDTYHENQLARYKRPAYRAKNHRARTLRVQAETGDFTAEQWEGLLRLYGHQCVYCGHKMTAPTVEHLTAVTKGGRTTLWNILPACKPCNSKKRDGAVLCPVQPALLVS